MLRYTIRRILQMIPVFLIATLIIFIVVRALPGDPVAAYAGERAASETLRSNDLKMSWPSGPELPHLTLLDLVSLLVHQPNLVAVGKPWRARLAPARRHGIGQDGSRRFGQTHGLDHGQLEGFLEAALIL